jgi:hypothetical protein
VENLYYWKPKAYRGAAACCLLLVAGICEQKNGSIGSRTRSREASAIQRATLAVRRQIENLSKRKKKASEMKSIGSINGMRRSINKRKGNDEELRGVNENKRGNAGESEESHRRKNGLMRTFIYDFSQVSFTRFSVSLLLTDLKELSFFSRNEIQRKNHQT